MVFSMSLEFLLSAFLRQKHFSLEPFSQHLVLPVAEKHLRHSLGLCFTFYGHLLRSASRWCGGSGEFELARSGRPESQVGAYRRRSHWVPRDRGRWKE